MVSRRALITGITGQDGSYLAELLLQKGYTIYGMYRRTSMDVFERLGDFKEDITLVQGDVTDSSSIHRALREVRPDEVYHLAAQSFVPASWSQPLATGDINALGTARMLEGIREVDKGIRFYQASSSEMFGKVKETPQSEATSFYPRSPYGVAKVFGHWITVNYRESYGLHASNGILFNHESPRRGKQFVTRKISHSVAKIKLGLQNVLELGNLNARRDWGYTGDFVEAMWLMLQQQEPDDYVIATGKSYSVRQFAEEAFRAIGMDISWEGEGHHEVGKCEGETVVRVNQKFYRPAEVDSLVGNAEKARKKLGWRPRVSFKELVHMMIESDLKGLSGKR